MFEGLTDEQLPAAGLSSSLTEPLSLSVRMLETGASTDALFEEVLFATSMGNEYQNCETEILVTAQAVQFVNNGATVEEAAGWPEL